MISYRHILHSFKWNPYKPDIWQVSSLDRNPYKPRIWSFLPIISHKTSCHSCLFLLFITRANSHDSRVVSQNPARCSLARSQIRILSNSFLIGQSGCKLSSWAPTDLLQQIVFSSHGSIFAIFLNHRSVVHSGLISTRNLCLKYPYQPRPFCVILFYKTMIFYIINEWTWHF